MCLESAASLGIDEQPCQPELINGYAVIFRDLFQGGAGHSSGATNRRPWHEADLFFFAICEGVVPFSVGDVVAVLHGHDRYNLARSLNLLG